MTWNLDMTLCDPYRPATLHARLCSAAWMVGYDQRPIDDAQDLFREAGYEWVAGYREAFERGHKDRMEAL